MPNQTYQLTKPIFCIFYEKLETEAKKNLLMNFKKLEIK